MNLPEGRLVRSRVVEDPGQPLVDALDAALTGYAVLEPADSLLLDSEGRGVLTFEDGVPVLAYHTGTDRGGPPAVGDLAVPGPYRVDLVALPAEAVGRLHDTPALSVPPSLPARRLAGDDALVRRTRERAPRDRVAAAEAEAETDDERVGAVEAFLDDEETVAAIREQAREEARRRASEWGFTDVGE